ncbi:hypothetical protein E2C01_069885 [Portunus trituberculatus]|uniref:Uncharacterized protein n=1 Tax=Portunus trituberculatus TaxID=210409 RepID=A0A5B7I3Z6_PORTR|nr:hypothetical protein [Portunus trituberculatus]
MCTCGVGFCYCLVTKCTRGEMGSPRTEALKSGNSCVYVVLLAIMSFPMSMSLPEKHPEVTATEEMAMAEDTSVRRAVGTDTLRCCPAHGIGPRGGYNMW